MELTFLYGMGFYSSLTGELAFMKTLFMNFNLHK